MIGKTVRLLPSLDSGDDHVLSLVGVVPFYVAFFACVTRAFALFGLMEFRRESGQSPRSAASISDHLLNRRRTCCS
jgi:hypothetical protein